MNVSDTVEKTGKFMSTQVGNDLIIFNDESGEYLGLGEIGTEIFALIDDRANINSIVDRLKETYDVERPILEADVMSFLDQLLKNDLIRIV